MRNNESRPAYQRHNRWVTVFLAVTAYLALIALVVLLMGQPDDMSPPEALADSIAIGIVAAAIAIDHWYGMRPAAHAYLQRFNAAKAQAARLQRRRQAGEVYVLDCIWQRPDELELLVEARRGQFAHLRLQTYLRPEEVVGKSLLLADPSYAVERYGMDGVRIRVDAGLHWTFVTTEERV